MPLPAVAIPQFRSKDVERFWSKVNKNGPTAAHMDTPCWLWTDAPSSNGYGLFWVNPRKVLAHRFSYELSVGPIPDGHQLDHRCFVHPCVNHGHLVPATHQQNCQNRERPGSGVYWDKQRGKWRAQNHNMGTTKYVGSFDTREEAKRAAMAVRLER